MARFPINELRRRGPGPRSLIYLDQSTLSFLITEDGYQLRERLRQGVRSGVLVCPSSPDHADESLLAMQSHASLHDLADELSMGIEMKWDFEIQQNEIIAASATFVGRLVSDALWHEAFEKDPQTPRRDLFPGGFRVSLAAQRADWQVREVEYEKDGVKGLTEAYERIRANGRSFEDQAELEFGVMVKWKLGPLVAPTWYRERVDRLKLRAAQASVSPADMLAPGSPFNLYSSAVKEADFCEYLVSRFPELREQPNDFGGCDQLRACPSLVFPSLITAALATMVKRKAKAGDRYDQSHLMKGLSRCDVVTADSGMAQLCRDRKLIPQGVTLYSSVEHERLLDHVDRLLAAQGADA